MTLAVGSTGHDSLAANSRSQELIPGYQPSARRILRLIVTVFALNVISAALFIYFVNRPSYDDPFNIFDVHTYATKGLSISTIRSNKNPPGPTSFLWMAAAVRLLHGDELRDARIGALLSWVLLVLGVVAGVRYGKCSEIWYGALLTLLVFPHSLEATALVLTEGPGLLFAVLGAMAWIEFASRPDASRGLVVLGILGGLSMGLAVTCRQYYLAMLPAAALLAFHQSRARASAKKVRRSAWVILSLVVAAIPIMLLVIIWKGISSPGMAAGTSYPIWKAQAGLNLFRPVIAAFYAAFYLLPVSFPIMLFVKPARRRWTFLGALLAGFAAGYCNSSILQPGPLHTFVHAVSRGTTLQSIVFGLIAVVTTYNTVAVGQLLWDWRTMLLSNPPLVFALLGVIFFVIEQFGVGGNLPLYDRYLLQLAPFLGIIAFSILPCLAYPRVLAISALSLLSQVMLWRYAFGAGSL